MKGNKINSKKNPDGDKEKSSGNKAIVRIVIFLIVIILCLAAYFLIFKKSDNNEKSVSEKNLIKENPKEKKIIDSAKKQDSLRIVKKEFTGKYLSSADPKYFRELKADGTFYAEDGPVKGSGTYTIDSTTILFKYDVGMEAASSIIDNKIIDDDKEVWVLKK